MLSPGDLKYARHLARTSMRPDQGRWTIDDLRQGAAEAPAFGFPLRFLAALLEHVLDEADRVGLDHSDAIAEFQLRILSEHAATVAIVHRLAAAEVRR